MDKEKGVDGKQYKYICTHVNDFIIVSKDSQTKIDKIKVVHIIESIEPPNYYLGHAYKNYKRGSWCIVCLFYLKEAINRVKQSEYYPSNTIQHKLEAILKLIIQNNLIMMNIIGIKY